MFLLSMMKFPVINFLLLACLALSSKSMAQMPQEIDEHPASILKAATVNSEAWRQGDVLVRTTITHDTTDDQNGVVAGAILTSEKLTRFVFDYEQRKMACYEFGLIEIIDFDNKNGRGEANTIKKSNWHAAVVDFENDELVFCHDSERIQHKKASTAFSRPDVHSTKEADFLIPDFRGIWYVGDYKFNAFQKAAKSTEFVDQIDSKKYSLRHDKTLTLLRCNTQFIADKEYQGTIDYQIDRMSLMPKACAMKIFVWDDRPPINQLDIKTEWKNINEIYVPLKFVDVAREKIQYLDAEKVGINTKVLDFHWFSLNTDVKTFLLDGSQVGSMDRVLKLTNPKGTGAMSLTESQSESSNKTNDDDH